MGKKTFSALVLLIAAAVLFWAFYANVARNPFKGKKLTVGVFDCPPFSIKDVTSGNYSGFAIDILLDIARRKDLELEFREIKLPDIFRSLESGETDISVPLTIDPEREKIISFTWPIEETGLGMIVRRKDVEKIKGPEDFKKKTIGCSPGTGQELCEKYKKEGLVDNYICFENFRDPYSALIDGRVDAVINDIFLNLYFEEKNMWKIKNTGKRLTQSYVGFGIKKDNRRLQEILNRGIKETMKSGRYSDIHNKYIKSVYE